MQISLILYLNYNYNHKGTGPILTGGGGLKSVAQKFSASPEFSKWTNH